MTQLKFAVKKNITVPLIKVEIGKDYYVKFEGKIFQAKENEGTRKSEMAAPDLVHVINLETGEVGQIIVSHVLKTELTEAYPNDSYVGKSFRIIKEKVDSKRYATFQISEIEVVTDSVTPKADKK